MKKVLIITYYWPPCGGIGVLRCLKFAKYLRAHGWEPVIFTADNADYPSLDKTNFKDIPDGVEVIKQKIREPYKVFRFITGQSPNANVNNVFYASDAKKGVAHNLSVWIRSNFFIPDARCLWINPSVKRIKEYLKVNHIDAIISNGPPHTNTRIATIIKKKYSIPWIADFQDPWTQVDYFSLLSLTVKADLKHKRYEREVFKFADRITIVSDTWKKDLSSIGAQNVSVINWGFDPDDYKELKPKPKNKFSICHIGILGYDRNPESLFKIIHELCKENKMMDRDLEINFAGQVDHSVIETAEKYGITEKIKLLGNLSRTNALKLAKFSSILLLPLNQQSNAKGRIPGKLFEYLALRNPILCLGSTIGDSATIINETKSGSCFNYKDETNMKLYLLSKYQEFIKFGFVKPIVGDISKYTSFKLTGKLVKLLNEITG